MRYDQDFHLSKQAAWAELSAPTTKDSRSARTEPVTGSRRPVGCSIS
jgi:hypothetical protein